MHKHCGEENYPLALNPISTDGPFDLLIRFPVSLDNILITHALT